MAFASTTIGESTEGKL